MEVSAIDFKITSPVLILSAGAFLLLMNEVTAKSSKIRHGITALTLVAAILMLFCVRGSFEIGTTAFGGLVYGDPFTFLVSMIILIGSLTAYILGARSLEKEGISSIGEYYSLFLMSIAGAIVLISARELILLFVGLEIMSIALYTMCALNLWSSRSSEAGLKYFLLGSFSSAIFLYGISLLYGLTGSLFIPEIAGLLITDGAQSNIVLYAALGFILTGFGFKIGLVPFHFWIPDVYQGAPTAVTAFMACVIKAAAVSVALRGMWVLFGEPNIFANWTDLIWILSVLTMTLGNLIALRQRSVKRMLAYSSIAHAGYMFVAFLAPNSGGGPAVMFYLVAYMIMTFGAFGVVMAVSDSAPAGTEGDHITRFNGLGFKNPVLGVFMTIFIFSLAGLPPGLAGFLGKFYLFSAAVKANYIGLVIIAVINSAISCYYYLRVLVAMYFTESENDSTVTVNIPMFGALTACAVAALFLGMFPSQLHELSIAATSSFGFVVP